MFYDSEFTRWNTGLPSLVDGPGMFHNSKFTTESIFKNI
jgi:hypothetical protein